MMEPLGASQVLSYLKKLSFDYEYFLISLEKKNDIKDNTRYNELKAEITFAKIHWFPIVYKSSKIGKIFNFFRFFIKANQISKHYQIKFVHARSYPPAVVAYALKKLRKMKYLFDTRGFAFDERADIGSLNRKHFVFRFLKRLEKRLYTNASGIVMLSELGKRTILDNQLFQGGNKIKNIEVIPTCTDLNKFVFEKNNNKKPITIGYVGTVTGWYNFDKTLKTYKTISEEIDCRLLIYNKEQYHFIKEKLIQHGIDLKKVKIESVSFSEMPQKLKEIDIALFFIHPFFSKKASAATKLGEFFATGIPVLTNKDVGDHEYYIDQYHTGKIINGSEVDYKTLINGLLTNKSAQRCRDLAEKYFSLDKGVGKYKSFYEIIFKNEKLT